MSDEEPVPSPAGGSAPAGPDAPTEPIHPDAGATGASGTAGPPPGEPTDPADREPRRPAPGAVPPSGSDLPPGPPPAPPPGPPPEPPGESPGRSAHRWWHRSTTSRVVAGVAGGLGETLDIDPVLPRVAFAVLTVFGGLGIVLYLMCWLLLPDSDGAASPAETLLGRGSPGRGTLAGHAVLAAAAIVAAVLYVDRHDGVDFALPAAVLLVGFLLARHLAAPDGPAPQDTGPGTPYQPAYATWRSATDPAPGSTSGSTAGRASGPTFAPASGPAPGSGPGSAGSAGPATGHATGRVGGARLWVITLCLACILAGLLVGAHRALGFGLSVRSLLALALALIGAALVVGAWWGRARGLILLGIPLAAVLVAANHPLLYDWANARTQTWRPASVADLDPVYRLGAGRAVLDLRNVDLTGAQRNVTVQVVSGDLRVDLPPDVDVEVHGRVELGSMTVLGTTAGGIGRERTVTDDGADGPGGARLHLFAGVGVGHLEVDR